MRAQDIIAKKRDGYGLTSDEIRHFIAGYVTGDITDYQASAFLMAVYIRGMDSSETATLTRAMAESGQILSLLGDHVPNDAATVDKHSTGGVGDKASLIVVPLLAAAGAYVCKMSGRGLGHTGGTLDKLESIPGFRVGLSPNEMMSQVGQIGACLAGQTDTLAPADKKLYALRDATATVGCLPLIVSSILSKKLAGGAQSFVFDVKVGDGALVRSLDEATILAQALVDGAYANGRQAVAVLSNMDAPLGKSIGNALEIAEAISVLRPDIPADQKDARLVSLCLTLTGEALALSGIVADPKIGYERAEQLLLSGNGLKKFEEIIGMQGGDIRVIDDANGVLPQAPVQIPVRATADGAITEIAARQIGEIVVRMGGGRQRKEDAIDPSVGITLHHSIGQLVRQGQPLATIHAATRESAEINAIALEACIRIATATPAIPELIHKIIRKQ